ncbi:tRNA pseudouridine(38-40) synthase TruA [Vulcanisaeta thermophila]|uniref:tRNA pseudouridine(38-40) synthase TruA n=1 Tax=Vulcanisaeta thermophila TaxID=867917 RepID=UPI000B1E0556|nr:tRNA pseudouridine(38-40) synthase TruA [Vulcanisaeta thermophila]
MVVLAFKVFYDGTLFSGFSGGFGSVEYYLRRALSYYLGGDYRLSKASRTDPGVSAVGNVVSVVTNGDAELVPGMLNSRLPRGIRVWASARVGDDFNARRASSRTYVYLAPWGGEDVGVMARGARLFIGTHDLVNFQVRERGVPTRVTIMDLSVSRVGDLLVFRVVGRGFRNKMIRKIVNALLMLGNGSLTLDVLEGLINNSVSMPIPPAPPHGLFLLRVDYGEREPRWVVDLGSIIDIINFVKNRLLYLSMSLSTTMMIYQEFVGLVNVFM